MLKIYGPVRSRSSRALWMAQECGVPYEHDDLSSYATRDEKSAAMRKINPIGKIPVLADGEFILAESMAINLYLAKKHGRHLWPTGEQEQAKVLQWSFLAVTELDPPLAQLMVERTFRKEADRNAENEKKNADLVMRPLGALEAHLADHDWLVGSNFSVADLNVASVLMLAPGAKLDFADYPRLKSWLDRCHDRPAYRKVTAGRS
ncbi:MAG: glutathione S-transferase family protein [Chromatiales bacterium]|jgi:glutathione S-transferase|nr:MAG: glutathione S-transferase family protein [Chromatiales bacterium]